MTPNREAEEQETFQLTELKGELRYEKINPDNDCPGGDWSHGHACLGGSRTDGP
jgi:hypothetical protein